MDKRVAGKRLASDATSSASKKSREGGNFERQEWVPAVVKQCRRPLHERVPGSAPCTCNSAPCQCADESNPRFGRWTCIDGDEAIHDSTTLIRGEHDIWAAGKMMPSHGKTNWRVRIDHMANSANDGRLMLGVCDNAGLACTGWGLSFSSGEKQIRNLSSGDEHGNVNNWSPCPPGFPDFHLNVPHRFTESNGRFDPALSGRAIGSVIQFDWNADKGILQISINKSAKAVLAFDGRNFPPHAALRPWAFLYSQAGDQVTIEGELNS